MAGPSIFHQAVGSLTVPGVYQTGSSLESAVFWLVLAIAIIMGAGLILYLFFVRGSYERERQAALALVGGRRAEAVPRDDSYYRSASSYSYRGEVPDAVAAAMSGMREEPVEEVEVVEEGEDEALPAYLYGGRRPAPGPRRGAPLPPPRAYDGRVDRPPRAQGRAPRGAGSPLDDLLGPGDRDGLREEDRELLRQEQLEPEPQAPGLSEDEEVTFEDEPEPAPAVHPPAPYRVGPREKPVWERVLEGGPPTEEAGAGPPGPAEEAEVELVDMDEPAPPRKVLSKPVSDMLLREDILKSVKGAPQARAPPPARRPPAAARPAGPAWTEGRPVFSKPLEEPDVPPSREAPRATGLEDTLGEISHKLRSMDERPRLPPKAEAKMGVQEKKFLEALRAVQEKKREEERAQEEEGRRLLEAQMQELERRKREEEEKRRAEERRRARERADRELRERAERARLEQAHQGAEQRLRSAEENRADEQRARQEAVKRENERRRREARSRQDKSADIDDVLSRIGIK